MNSLTIRLRSLLFCVVFLAMTLVVGCTPGTLTGPELDSAVTTVENGGAPNNANEKGGATHNTESSDNGQSTGKGGDHIPNN